MAQKYVGSNPTMPAPTAVKHPGFRKIQRKLARRYGMKRAGAILASSARHASAAAKRRNPRLLRVR